MCCEAIVPVVKQQSVLQDVRKTLLGCNGVITAYACQHNVPRSVNSTKLNLIIAYSEYILNLVKLMKKNLIFKLVCYSE